jgi:DNA-binding XRE family transcriptional regulator
MRPAMPAFHIATNCHHDGGMADWQRLAHHITARRTELGHTNRDTLADQATVSPRTLGDLETGRKTNYYPSTLARIERALQWTTGSIDTILNGGDPTPLNNPGRPTSQPARPDDGNVSGDEALIRVMSSPHLNDDQRRQIMDILLKEKAAADRARAEHAQHLIDLARRTD